jgi:hypothetical protein
MGNSYLLNKEITVITTGIIPPKFSIALVIPPSNSALKLLNTIKASEVIKLSYSSF